MNDDDVLREIREQLYTANLLTYYTGIGRGWSRRADEIRETIEERLGVGEES